MFKMILILVALAGLLAAGNMLQVSVIKEQEHSDLLLRTERKLAGAFPFLKKGQRLYYDGLRIVDTFDLYFISAHVLAPRFLLDARMQLALKGDTVLGLYSHDNLTDTLHYSSLLWTDTDDSCRYYLYIK